jgi:hypothetical protein
LTPPFPSLFGLDARSHARRQEEDYKDAMTAARVEQFWCEFFGVPAERPNTAGVTIVPHKGLGSYVGAWLFMRGTSGIVSCPREWVTRVRGLGRERRLPS